MVSWKNNKTNLKSIFILLRVGIGITLLYTLIHILGAKSIYESIKSINLLYYPVIILGFFIFILISAFCIKVLVDAKISFSNMLKYYSLSWVFGLLLPSKLGEFSLAFFLKKENIPLARGLSISLLDKIITFLLFFVISSFGIFLFFTPVQSLILIAICFFIVLSFFLVLILNYDRLLFFLPQKYTSHFKDFIKETCFFFKYHRGRLYLNLFLSITRWGINAFILLLIFLSLGISVNFFLIYIINAIIALVSLIPITINGLGIRQSIGVFLFSKMGINSAIALDMLLIQLILTYSFAFLLYAYYNLKHNEGQLG